MLGIGTWLGWHLFATILTTCIGFALVTVLPCAGCTLLLAHWVNRGPVLLSGLLLFCIVALSWAILADTLLPIPACDRFAFIGLRFGLFLGLLFGLGASHDRARVKKASASRSADLRMVAWRDAMLAALALTLFAARSKVLRIKWGRIGSVALAVTAGPDGGLTVDLYGHGVSQKTVKVALDDRLEPGWVERIHYFGWEFARGFIPFTERPGGRIGTIRRLVFHHTQVGDEIVPSLVRLPQLQRLDLRETRMSRIGVQTIRASLPACEVLR